MNLKQEIPTQAPPSSAMRMRIEQGGGPDLVHDAPAVLAIGNALHARYGGAYGDDPDAYRAVIAQQAPKRVGIALRMEHVFSWDFGKLPGLRTNRP